MAPSAHDPAEPAPDPGSGPEPTAADPRPGGGGSDGGSDGRVPDDPTLTVGQLCRRIEDTVAGAFPDEVWVQGAISGLNRSANGHVYFDLVDPSDEVGTSSGATLPVALFASSRTLVNRILRKAGGIRMHDGIEIRIRGRVAYYPPQGRVQLIMSLIDPQFTLGQMVAARAALLERLRADGLLERNRLLELPALPLRVALVTSGASAAFHDFTHELHASGHPFRITLLDSRVQGIEAVPSLAEAIEAAGRLAVDVVVVARGGGSRTDLVAFDHERVAVAVARCPHPVVVGVGHEIDRSVTDEVAHTSAKTPTACARVLIEAVDRFRARLDGATGRLGGLARLHLSSAQDRLVGNGDRLARAARWTVERQERELTHAGRLLVRTPDRVLERGRDRLDTSSARLGALDPVVALRRGWTITRTADGRLVRSVGDVTDGTELRTTTMDGMIASRVVDDPTSGQDQP
jgi:exodeoxyribonuclease VII large subunit